MNPFNNEMLPGSGNSFKDYVDRLDREQDEREDDYHWLKESQDREDS